MVGVQVLRMMDTGTGQARRAWSIPVAAPRSNVLRATPVLPIVNALVTTSGERCRSIPDTEAGQRVGCELCSTRKARNHHEDTTDTKEAGDPRL